MQDEHDAVEPLATDLTGIDTRTAGLAQVTAGYLLRAPRPTLFECGPAKSIDTVIAALHALGFDPDDLAYLVVSHIHLDHAGGAGDLARAFPNATVVVSDLGAAHLVDPTKLNASARRVYGSLHDRVYGDCTPVQQEQVRAVTDGEVLDLGGGRRLELLHTPGHAKHHISAFDPDSGWLFAGDSVGVKLPGMRVIRPATPPPDFDLALARRTLDRYQSLEPSTLWLAHYGPLREPMAALDEALERLAAWAETAERAWAEHDELDHVAETLAQRFADDIAPDVDDPEATERLELLNGVESNAAGLLRYFRLREEGRVADDSS